MFHTYYREYFNFLGIPHQNSLLISLKSLTTKTGKHSGNGLYPTTGVTGAAVVAMLSNPGELLPSRVGVPVD